MASVETSQEEKSQYLIEHPNLDPLLFRETKPIPKFSLYSLNRSLSEKGKKKIIVGVINIKCAADDKVWLNHLLVMATRASLRPYLKFVPVNVNPKSYKYQITKQKCFLESTTHIPIIGLTQRAAQTLVPDGETQVQLQSCCWQQGYTGYVLELVLQYTIYVFRTIFYVFEYLNLNLDFKFARTSTSDFYVTQHVRVTYRARKVNV